MISVTRSPFSVHRRVIGLMKVKVVSCVQLFVTPRTVARQVPLSMGFSRQEYWSGPPGSSVHGILQAGILEWPARFLCPWDSPGRNTGVGCHFLLQRIFPAQRSKPGLLHCRRILYHLSHQGSHLSHRAYEIHRIYSFHCH